MQIRSFAMQPMNPTASPQYPTMGEARTAKRKEYQTLKKNAQTNIKVEIKRNNIAIENLQAEWRQHMKEGNKGEAQRVNDQMRALRREQKTDMSDRNKAIKKLLRDNRP